MKVFHFCLCRTNQISVCIVKIEKQNKSVKSMFMFIFRQLCCKIDTYRKSVIRVQILPFLLRVLRTLLHPAFLILCITA